MRAVVLLNLGTPNSLKWLDIASYLREFLMDERVVDINPIVRFMLVHGVILPFRTFKTQKAYKSIWTEKGSPLRVYTQSMVAKLQECFNSKDVVVDYAMRYGNPSIKSVIDNLLSTYSIEELIIFPLFPQYANASTGSALAKTLEQISKNPNIPSIRLIHEFHKQEFFIDAQAAILKEFTNNHEVQHVLFSFHGLPVRQVKKSCNLDCADKLDCTTNEKQYFCYKQQSYLTAEALAKKVEIKEYSVAFQSRLGRIPWIKPYTDEILVNLVKKYKKIAICCPSFLVDCLETLEEIGDRAKEDWIALGGEELYLIPCVNDNDLFVSGLAKFIN